MKKKKSQYCQHFQLTELSFNTENCLYKERIHSATATHIAAAICSCQAKIHEEKKKRFKASKFKGETRKAAIHGNLTT